MLSNVDFPEPDGPMRAVNEPSSMSSDRSVKTSTRCVSRKKALLTSRISTSAMGTSGVGCRVSGSFGNLYAHTGLRSFDSAGHQHLAAGQAGAHFAKSAAHRAGVHLASLETALTHEPHDRLAAIGADRRGGHADARRAGLHSRARRFGLEEIHPRAHLG